MIYNYKGYKGHTKVSGEIEATSKKEAIIILRNTKGISAVTNLKEKKDNSKQMKQKLGDFKQSLINIKDNLTKKMTSEVGSGGGTGKASSKRKTNNENFDFLKKPLPEIKEKPEFQKKKRKATKEEKEGLNVDVKGLDKVKRIYLKKKERVFFFARISTLLGAGLGLIKSLEVMERNVKSKPYKKMLLIIKNDLKNGENLASSLTRFPDVFSHLQISMIYAGEMAGSLNNSFNELARLTREQMEIEKKIRSMSIYPVIVFIILLILLIGAALFFIPLFEELFNDMSVPVPVFTEIVFLVIGNIHVPLITLVILMVVNKILRRIPKYKETYQKIKDVAFAKLPVLGNYTLAVSMYYYSTTIAVVLKNGVSIMQCLDLAKGTVPNSFIQRDFNAIKDEIVLGTPLAEAYRKYGVEPLLAEMVEIGEETGGLSDSFNKAAEYYEDNLKTQIDLMSQMFQPLTILVLAGVIIPLIIGIFVPLLKMSSGAYIDF